MKRFLSLFVALVMIISLFSGVEIKVSAEGETTPTEITEVTLLNLPEVAYGKSTSFSGVTVPEGANYTVDLGHSSTRWLQRSEGSIGSENYLAETFGYGTYYAHIRIVPNEGYTFAENMVVTNTGCILGTGGFADNTVVITPECAIEKDKILQVDLSWTEPVKGAAPNNNLTLPTDANYTKDAFSWLDTESGNPVTDTFGSGFYSGVVTLNPNTGYAFSEDLTVTVNGADVTDEMDWGINPDGNFYGRMTYAVDMTEIDTVEISYTKPVLGQAAPEITLKNADQFDIFTLNFHEYSTDAEDGWGYMYEDHEIFRNGHKYDVTIDLYPAAGYIFAEDVTLIINGTEYTVSDENNIYIDSDNDEDSFCASFYIYDFIIEIDTVEISYTVPVMGSEIPEITLKNAEYFGSYYTYWYNLDTDEYEDDTFEEGEYQLEFDVYTASGCRFAEDVTFIVNGEVCECDDPNVYGNDNYTFYHDFQVVDGRSVISEIEYPAWPVCEVGDPIPEPVADSSSEDVPYFVLTEYMVIDENGSYEEASGTFEAGKLYMMTYYAVVNPDYRTDATTKFTQDGAAVTPTKLEAAYPTEVYTLTKYGNNSTLDIIDTADLQLTLPALAEEPSQVTVKETAPYQITDYSWFIADEIPTVSDVAPAADLEMVEDIFIPGYPVLYVDLTTQDDSDDFTSIFSANTKITVNGSDATVLYTNTYNPSTIFAAIVFDELKPITIPAVDFPAWPELKVGDSIPKSTTIPVDEDLHYLLAMQIQEVNGESSGESTITIEDGKTYSMTLIAYNTSDYHAFTDATVVTQNGQPTSDRIDPDIFDMPESFASRIILLTKYYNFNEDMTIVEAMDITVDEPVIGEMPGSITVDEDFPLTFIEAFWGITDDGTLDGADDKTSAWAEGDIPLIGIRISENEKAMLSPALKITVNGKSAKIIGLMPDMDSDDNTSFFITVALDALVAEPVDYDIISGNGSSWTVGSNGNVTMTANGDFSKFLGLDVDGNEVAASNYEARSGSTIVELKASYLATLSEGQHTITFNYTDGSASGTFEIKRTSTNPTTPSDPTTPSNPSNPSDPTTPSTPGDTPSTPTTPSNSGNAADTPATPETGDNSNLALWTGLLLVSALAMCYIVLNNKKRRNA